MSAVSRDQVLVLAELIAKKRWQIEAEEEQSKSDYDIDVPAWEDLGSHQQYLTHMSESIAWTIFRAGYKAPSA